MDNRIYRILQGDTRTFTWVSSGQTPSPIQLAIQDQDENVLQTETGVSSGNGHYYANINFDASSYAPGFYAAFWSATMGGQPHKRRLNLQIVPGGV